MISPLIWAAAAGLAVGIVRAAWQLRRPQPKQPVPQRAGKPRAPRRTAKAAAQGAGYVIRGHAATEEQARAIDLARTRESLKIEAAAGSGKTSTLVGIAENLGGKGLYLAFNRAIAEEASGLFPAHVDCRTAHSLAYQAVGHRYAERLRAPLTAARVGEHLGRAPLPPAAWGARVLAVLGRFLHSAAPVPGPAHAAGEPPELAEALVRDAAALWQALIDPRGRLPVTHDVYLKLWALQRPRLGADFILFDEAQDANAALVELVGAQPAQTIWVGDRCQQIYAWRGALNAMDAVACRHTTRITQSFRFGPRIAQLANAVLEHWLGADLRVRGNPRLKSRVGACEPQALLCRTNHTAVAAAVAAREAGRRVSFGGALAQMPAQLRAAQALRAGRPAAQPALAGLRSWEELEARAQTPAGGELQGLVRLARQFDLDRLASAVEAIAAQPEAQAELVVTTAHKSKGREWRNVRLADDFRHPDSKGYTREDANLLYVAITRAQQGLDIRDCQAARRLLEG